MKYLKRFNESIEQQIYEQFLDTVRDCFLEFEDAGWVWATPYSGHNFPHFNCIMMDKKDNSYEPPHLRDYLDWTGEIKSSGEIVWDTKELEGYNSMIETRDEIIKGPIKEEAENFLVAVKRINSETGLDFRFSYNNRGGEKRIIIQGRI